MKLARVQAEMLAEFMNIAVVPAIMLWKGRLWLWSYLLWCFLNYLVVLQLHLKEREGDFYICLITTGYLTTTYSVSGPRFQKVCFPSCIVNAFVASIENFFPTGQKRGVCATLVFGQGNMNLIMSKKGWLTFYFITSLEMWSSTEQTLHFMCSRQHVDSPCIVTCLEK